MADTSERPPLAVTAAVIRRGDTVLLARRAAGKALAGLWEFPGGKIEPGETPEACLARELAEEFAIAAAVDEHILTSRYEDRHMAIELHAYAVRLLGGEIRLTDHDAVVWAPLADLRRYPVPPPDEPIVAWLLAARAGGAEPPAP